MSFPAVNINQLNGGSGRPQPGYDYYSGLMLYGTAPVVADKWPSSTGTTVIKYQQMFSYEDAASAGILPYTENTAPTSTYLITTKGDTGDTIQMKVTVPKQNSTTEVVDLGTYTVLVADSTIALQGAAWAAVINAGTVTHGYSAVFNTATLTITAPKSVGKSLNTGTPYAVTIVGAFVGVLTQNVIAGTASQYAVWDYHIKEYFRINATGNLTVGIRASVDSFYEVAELQTVADNKLRWIGVYDIDATRAIYSNITGAITLLDTACKLKQKTAPFSAFYSPNIKAVSDLSTYPDQNLNTANKVQCILSQDGLADGALLFVTSGQTVGNIGAKLGSISKGRVSASDAQPIEIYNMSNGVENNTPAFGNGLLSSSVSTNLQIQLDNYNYTFFRQFGDTVVGTYWTGNKCCVISSSSYANVNDNAVSDKVSRICYTALVPQLNSELLFNANGTLKDYTVEYFQTLVIDAVTANMITGYGAMPLISGVGCTIDPSQPVRQTSNLTIDVTIVENGIARNITVNIGYGTLSA